MSIDGSKMNEYEELYSSKPFAIAMVSSSIQTRANSLVELANWFPKYIGRFAGGEWRIRVKYKFNDASKRDGGTVWMEVGEGCSFIKLTGCPVSAGGSMKTNRRKGCQILEPSRRAYCEKLALKLSYRAAVQMKRGCLPAVFHR